MTYQKSFLHLLAVTMVFSLGALFSACGSDDDKNEIDNGKGSASDIIGTWGLVLKEYKIPNEQGGTNQSTAVYDYLNPSKGDELVISLASTDRGESYFTMRQYFYDYSGEIWKIASKDEAFMNGMVLALTNSSTDQSYSCSINGNKLVMESKQAGTDYFIRYTFKKISTEVKNTDTLHIIP